MKSISVKERFNPFPLYNKTRRKGRAGSKNAAFFSERPRPYRPGKRFLHNPLDNFFAVCYNTFRQCGIAKR